MLMSTIASVFFAFLFGQGTLAALTPKQVVANINIVAAVSRNTNDVLMQVSTTMSLKSVRTSSEVGRSFPG
jgi:hypothetical protein